MFGSLRRVCAFEQARRESCRAWIASGADIVAAAMIDRLVHHAEVISLKGDSYRLKNRDLGRIPAASHDHGETP
jgi:IstB-like ATP binding protein